MKLPEGFVLEEKAQPTMSLPEGFVLEIEQPTQQPQDQPGFLNRLGRGVASVADTTIGAVLPTVAGMATYPIARTFMSPEEASATTERVVGAVDKPFGKAFGVANTPEYTGEASQQLIAFIGENISKGAEWISEKTGLPVSDVENMIGTASLAIPAIARKTSEVASIAAADVKAGTRLAFDESLTAREQRLSSKDYQRGPQIEAVQDAQRLGIAIPPEAAKPGVATRVLSATAGESGPMRLTQANQQNVRAVALKELGLDKDTQLNSATPFDEARSKVAGPYNRVRALPTMTADSAALSALDVLIKDSNVVGAEASAKAIIGIVKSTKKNVTKGINGRDLLQNIELRRSRARKVFNNDSADLTALDIAKAEMGVANVLESMIESNISNPKLLSDFRSARRQMAKSYAYENATNFNTGLVDVTKLAKQTATDSALTGDIAAIGRIADNFPEAFGKSAISDKDLALKRFGRRGLLGLAGGAAGYEIGGSLGGAIGMGLGAGLGELAQYSAARRIASPEYQKGLKVSDYRIPAAAQAVTAQAPIPNSQAIVPYQAPVEVLRSGEGPYNPNFSMQGEGQGASQAVWDSVSKTYRGEFPPQRSPISMGFPDGGPLELPAPSGQSTLNALRAEDTRRANMSRSIGQDRETAQAASEATQRRPTPRGIDLDFDPISGKFSEAGSNVRGATPPTLNGFNTSLETAANKITKGMQFDMTAAEKVAWNRTRVDLAKVQPSLKTLTNKAIAEKMLDRVWVYETAQKARNKADAFDLYAQRAKSETAVKKALVEREKLQDIAEQMEETIRSPRADASRKQQGPKTRDAFRDNLVSQDNNPKGMFTVDVSGFPK